MVIFKPATGRASDVKRRTETSKHREPQHQQSKLIKYNWEIIKYRTLVFPLKSLLTSIQLLELLPQKLNLKMKLPLKALQLPRTAVWAMSAHKYLYQVRWSHSDSQKKPERPVPESSYDESRESEREFLDFASALSKDGGLHHLAGIKVSSTWFREFLFVFMIIFCSHMWLLYTVRWLVSTIFFIFIFIGLF